MNIIYGWSEQHRASIVSLPLQTTQSKGTSFEVATNPSAAIIDSSDNHTFTYLRQIVHSLPAQSPQYFPADLEGLLRKAVGEESLCVDQSHQPVDLHVVDPKHRYPTQISSQKRAVTKEGHKLQSYQSLEAVFLTVSRQLQQLMKTLECEIPYLRAFQGCYPQQFRNYPLQIRLNDVFTHTLMPNETQVSPDSSFLHVLQFRQRLGVEHKLKQLRCFTKEIDCFFTLFDTVAHIPNGFFNQFNSHCLLDFVQVIPSDFSFVRDAPLSEVHLQTN